MITRQIQRHSRKVVARNWSMCLPSWAKTADSSRQQHAQNGTDEEPHREVLDAVGGARVVELRYTGGEVDEARAPAAEVPERGGGDPWGRGRADRLSAKVSFCICNHNQDALECL